MQIVALQPEHLDTLDEIYRRATGQVPHCRFAPSRETIRDALLESAREHTRIFVATDAGVPQGFAALRDNGSTDDGPREAEVTALFVDDATAGQMLLDAVTARAHEVGVKRLVAFPPEHFHGPIRA